MIGSVAIGWVFLVNIPNNHIHAFDITYNV